MHAPHTYGRQAMGDEALKLAQLTDDVLFNDVWERPELSKRDRSLVTVAALLALYAGPGKSLYAQPANEDTTQIEPVPAARMPGSTASSCTPALLTMTCTAPPAAAASAR